MNVKNTILIRTIAILLVIVASAFPAAAQSKNAAFERGVELFQAKDYQASLEQFKQAADASPLNVPIQLWLGLNYAALENFDKPQDIWRAGIGDEKWGNVVWALKGLVFWKQNQKHNAVYYFKQADSSKPNYKICQQLLASINNDEDLPPIEQWAQIANLSKPQTSTSAQTNDLLQPSSDPVSNGNGNPTTSGAKPSGGLWTATISNGYKGQTLSFRVSADGKTISDVIFRGYLQCRGSRIENTELAPLENIAVSGGAFNSTQLNGGAQVRFDFEGAFADAANASGTYRAMSSTDCDTYKLKWTATRVGK